MVYLNNAFSLNMIKMDQATINVKKVTKNDVLTVLANGYENVIGHADTANIVANDLNIPNNAVRKTIILNSGDILIVAQYIGPRLQEGTTTLPDGAKIEYYIVQIQ